MRKLFALWIFIFAVGGVFGMSEAIGRKDGEDPDASASSTGSVGLAKHQSKIILLNGASSAGKTSITKALQAILPEPYLTTGLDQVIYLMPASFNDYFEDLEPREGFGWRVGEDESGRQLRYLTPGPYGERVYALLRTQTRTFADEGFNVIVDLLSLQRDDYSLWREALKDHLVFMVGVFTDPDVLDQRESARGDRVIGVARAHHQKTHEGFTYDLTVDTTHQTPDTVALTIEQHLPWRASPS